MVDDDQQQEDPDKEQKDGDQQQDEKEEAAQYQSPLDKIGTDYNEQLKMVYKFR